MSGTKASQSQKTEVNVVDVDEAIHVGVKQKKQWVRRKILSSEAMINHCNDLNVPKKIEKNDGKSKSSISSLQQLLTLEEKEMRNKNNGNNSKQNYWNEQKTQQQEQNRNNHIGSKSNVDRNRCRIEKGRKKATRIALKRQQQRDHSSKMGYNKNNRYNSHREKSDGNSRPMQVVSCDFELVHRQCCAARYKVHKPKCSCKKIQVIKETVGNNDEVLQLLNGLLIVPETNYVPSIYVCLGTSEKDHQRNPLEVERMLRSEIFLNSNSPQSQISQLRHFLSYSATDEIHVATKKEPLDTPDITKFSTTHVVKGTAEDIKAAKMVFNNSRENSMFPKPFKISCAICLLQDQPNGFICVSSLSRSRVDFARDIARAKACQKKSLHADHADHLCTLPRKALWEIINKHKTSKAEQSKELAKVEVLRHMEQQGVKILWNSDYDSSTSTKSRCNDVLIQHHLESILHIINKDASAKDAYLLVMIYDHTNKKNPRWALDLPGGKRHLGETTLECAIRETEEETSLLIDERWLTEKNPRRKSLKGTVDGNAYFIVEPPSDIFLETIKNDTFWETS